MLRPTRRGGNSAENNFISFVVANQHFGSEQTLMKNSHWNLGSPLSFAAVSTAPLLHRWPNNILSSRRRRKSKSRPRDRRKKRPNWSSRKETSPFSSSLTIYPFGTTAHPPTLSRNLFYSRSSTTSPRHCALFSAIPSFHFILLLFLMLSATISNYSKRLKRGKNRDIRQMIFLTVQ